MFKFNFSNPNEVTKADERALVELKLKDDKIINNKSLEWFPAREMFPLLKHVAQELPIQMFSCGKYQLKHIPFEDAIKDVSNVDDESIAEAEIMHSDLLPAKYEGGLKIWECSRDLADYLCENVDFIGKRVLDLGCGTGLLGILTMQLGAISVHFQDYNASVINTVTMPNVLLNTSQLEEDGLTPSSRFFCGDWKSFADLINAELSAMENKYDLILTSETIYNPENYKKLVNVFKKCLNPDGVIYLAAKTYYFGVGGSIRQFEYILTEDGTFQSKVCWKCSKGIQREILKINFQETLNL